MDIIVNCWVREDAPLCVVCFGFSLSAHWLSVDLMFIIVRTSLQSYRDFWSRRYQLWKLELQNDFLCRYTLLVVKIYICFMAEGVIQYLLIRYNFKFEKKHSDFKYNWKINAFNSSPHTVFIIHNRYVFNRQRKFNSAWLEKTSLDEIFSVRDAVYCVLHPLRS